MHSQMEANDHVWQSGKVERRRKRVRKETHSAQLMVCPVVSMPAMKKTDTSLHRRPVDRGFPSLSRTLIKLAQMEVSDSGGTGLDRSNQNCQCPARLTLEKAKGNSD
jgi:hypothetical protein